jgi:2-methylisocitrate lyase-like PEP mutase family enzyme
VGFPSAALFSATAAVRKTIDALKRDGSLNAVAGDLMTLPEYYEIVKLTEQQTREDGYYAT